MSKQQPQDRAARLKAWFEQAILSDIYVEWLKEAKLCWDFYDGDQWSAEEASRLAEFGQPAIVINKIAAKVDNLAGVEVSGRTRVVYRSRSGEPGEESTARALTDVALYVAEQSEQALAISQVFRDGLVGGIGWLEIGVEDEVAGPRIFCRSEDPMSVVFDPLSRRADMSDARFVARERWLGVDELERLFAGKASAVKAAVASRNWNAVIGNARDEVRWYSAERELFRVVEIQYTEMCRQWAVRLPDGRLTVTWQKPESGIGQIEKVQDMPRVRVAYLSGADGEAGLLDDRWLPDGFEGFTLMPFIYRRQRCDGRPYGMVRAAVDPQRELNKRRSKAMHLLNTAQVIADIDAVDDPNVLAREAARPDGVILKRAGKDLRIIRNTDLASSQVAVMDQASRDIQEVIGIYDETLGKQSNATSGVAIQQRQVAGGLNQMALFDVFRVLKRKLGRQVLGLIRQTFGHEMVIRIVDQMGASRSVKLNERIALPDGKVLVMHDVSAGDYDVVVEEVRDVMSAREDEAQRLETLVKAGVPVPPAVLVEASGVRNKEAILSAMKVPVKS